MYEGLSTNATGAILIVLIVLVVLVVLVEAGSDNDNMAILSVGRRMARLPIVKPAINPTEINTVHSQFPSNLSMILLFLYLISYYILRYYIYINFI